MTPMERLQEAWIKAGYPKEYMPKQQFAQVADLVAEAYAAGEEDFLKAGWAKSQVDFPFAPGHPRYQAMLEAYAGLADQ
jgi:hypothetical protein